MKNYKEEIEYIWQNLENYTEDMVKEAKLLVAEVIQMLNDGKIRVAFKEKNDWIINDWLKKAILLYFKFSPNKVVDGQYTNWYDKIDLKFTNSDDFAKANIRAVPGSVVRYGAFVSSSVILMPSFVNIGAYIGSGTMIDTWATIGSCAQVGNNCHISGGVGIGGVLEPIQAMPVIIEDNCFIGARSEIAEGVIVGKGSVISMGVFISASTKIIDRASGRIYYGKVPDYSVVVPGAVKSTNDISLSCAVIVKTVDEKTRAKTSINELLRDVTVTPML